ncbi:MAG: phasin family protein [Pseudomonadota bacterium]
MAQKQPNAAATAEKGASDAKSFVRQAAARAKSSASGLHKASQEFNADLEALLLRASHGYVDALGSVAEAAYANMNDAVSLAEKLADAESLEEAMQIQIDYLRAQSETASKTARSAYETAIAAAEDSADALRTQTTKAWDLATQDVKAA